MVAFAAAATSAMVMSRAACSSMKAVARRTVAGEASVRSRAAGLVMPALGKTARTVAASRRAALPMSSGLAAGLASRLPA